MHPTPYAPRAINKQWCRMHNRHINRIESDAVRRAAHPKRYKLAIRNIVLK